ncbi:MAG: FAD-dependent oxidoreductase [Wenzhouxiangella sp.]|jgi:predicted NAD/FAD-dependent oxidoreductase|nr:FAD-dependent oxidoreductase [Wenzhouxiangella sp.]
MTHDVCIIGAGWSGLTAASELASVGLDVVVVEKARGPGGRCATRRQDGFAFDHGGQYFTARSPEFAAQTELWKSAGLVSAWTPQISVFGERPDVVGRSPAERLVATPGMNAVLKSMASSLDCRFGWRAAELAYEHERWRVRRDQEDDWIEAGSLLVTAPPQQSADLLSDVSALATTIGAVPMNPCWAVMLGFDAPLNSRFDAAFDNEGPLSWMARNSSKPGRSGEAWILHASAEWSRTHLEREEGWVVRELLNAFRQRVPVALATPPALSRAHRWRYALAPKPLAQDCLIDSSNRLTVAGDWCAGNRIEGAWISGKAAAEQILRWHGSSAH